MAQPATAPPSSEIGYVTRPTAPGWGYFGNGSTITSYEEVTELAWPGNVKIYHMMRTDAQVDALIRSVVMPLLRLNWFIIPNGAKPEIVQDISTQLNLPVQGEADQFVQRGRKRFNHAEHLRLSLLAPTVYGHMFFEMVGQVDADTLAWKLSKLAARMPQTISRIDVARDGGLVDIVQHDLASWRGLPIPVSQLVAYPWEKEGGNWFGRSMLRPLYKHWLLKDRLLRIDAMKNERFGLGIPYGTAAPGGDPAAMQRVASATRASETGGVGIPNGATVGIEGVRGTLPDTLGSIQYQDEAMARSFLAMFMQLGQTQTGSRALGSEFVDFFIDALAGFANWYANITSQHVIEDIVDWNWGEDEQAPLLGWVEREEQPLGIEELASLVKSGALLIDAELQDWIRKRYRMPTYTGGQPLPTRPGFPSEGYTLETNVPATIEAQFGNTDLPCADCGSGPGEPCTLRSGAVSGRWTHTSRLVDSGGDVSAQPRGKDGKWTADKGILTVSKLPSGRETQVTFLGSRTAASSQTLNDARIGHRDPTPIEVKAGTDFQKHQDQWEQTTKDVVDEWAAIRTQQINSLVNDIETAVGANDFTTLATLSAPVLGQDVILKHMKTIATQSVADAIAEAKSQGVTTAAAVDVTKLGLEARAEAIANLMARDLGGSASRNAILRYGTGQDVDASEIASGVRDQLEALSDSYLNDTLGGGMTQAQNTARRAVMTDYSTAGQKVDVYASELLDLNTCLECENEDSTSFTSMSAAEIDYPAGGYVNCAGGARCRGTLVAVYGETD